MSYYRLTRSGNEAQTPLAYFSGNSLISHALNTDKVLPDGRAIIFSASPHNELITRITLKISDKKFQIIYVDCSYR